MFVLIKLNSEVSFFSFDVLQRHLRSIFYTNALDVVVVCRGRRGGLVPKERSLPRSDGMEWPLLLA